MSLASILVGGLLIALGIDWLRDPEKAYKIDWLHHLMFPHSDPSKFYFIMVRIFAGWLTLMGLFLILGQALS